MLYAYGLVNVDKRKMLKRHVLKTMNITRWVHTL